MARIKREDGTYRANVGVVHVSGAYGGWRVDVIHNESGGVTTLTDYYAPARETYTALRAMVAVLREAGHKHV